MLENRHGCKCELEFFEGFDGICVKAREFFFGRFHGKASKRECDFRVMVDEFAIEIGKTKETLNFFDRCQLRPGGDSIEFLWMHLNTFGGNNVSKVFDLRLIKFTLLGICKYFGSSQTFENLTYTMLMIFTRF